jgi:hypothetical protein
MLESADNSAGAPTKQSPSGQLPRVGAEIKRMDGPCPVAELIGEPFNRKIILCRFEIRTELEVFDDTT